MILIQLIGLLAFLSMITSFYKKEYATILTYQAVGSFLYATHYFLLGALTGTFISCTNIARDILFKNINKPNIILPIILLLYVGITITFYSGPGSVIPLFGSGVYAIGMSRRSRKSILIGSLLSSLCWIIYNIFNGSYVGIITESLLFISNIRIFIL